MSTAAILKHLRDRLRGALSLAADQCAIAPTREPPSAAGPVFVGIADCGAAAEGEGHLAETVEIEITVWRRSGAWPRDRLGDALLPIDPYAAGLPTIEQIERAVIRAVHADRANLVAAINADLGPGDPPLLQPLYYQGRGVSEVVYLREETNEDAWIARRLKFRGMLRVAPLAA